MVQRSGMPTIPSAIQAASRLGCSEAFAIVDDQRSNSVRTLWIAEQTGLQIYKLREALGQGVIGRELDDPFALVYVQASSANVQVLEILAGTPDGLMEIQDDRGCIIVHRILSLRDRYDQGGPLSEAALGTLAVGDVVYVAVVDDQGVTIAAAPAKLERIDKDDNGAPFYFALKGDKGESTDFVIDPANLTGSQAKCDDYALFLADVKPDIDDPTEDDDDDEED